jgi:hypothetical protein
MPNDNLHKNVKLIYSNLVEKHDFLAENNNIDPKLRKMYIENALLTCSLLIGLGYKVIDCLEMRTSLYVFNCEYDKAFNNINFLIKNANDNLKHYFQRACLNMLTHQVLEASIDFSIIENSDNFNNFFENLSSKKQQEYLSFSMQAHQNAINVLAASNEETVSWQTRIVNGKRELSIEEETHNLGSHTKRLKTAQAEPSLEV